MPNNQKDLFGSQEEPKLSEGEKNNNFIHDCWVTSKTQTILVLGGISPTVTCVMVRKVHHLSDK